MGILPELKTVEIEKRDYLVQPVTYSVLGGDKLYLLTNKSKNKFQIDLKDTLYGIPQSKLAIDIYNRTNSMVRGEELMELLNLIVRFLNTHTHAYPGLPPVPVTQDGTSTTDILTELQNAYTKVLNSNIRIN